MLFDSRLHDGSRHFAELREFCSWDALRRHAVKLPGVVVTDYLSDDIMEMWLDFSYRGHKFTINSQSGDYWFIVDDPACPDDVLLEVLNHCKPYTG